MTCDICIYGFVVMLGAAHMFGLALGAFVAWDCITRMPKDEPKRQEWSEVDDESPSRS